MSREKPNWIETAALFSRLPPQKKLEYRAFFEEAIRFSSWYFAIHDQANLDPLLYLGQGFPVAAALKKEIPLPSQQFFQSALDVADAFLTGYVNPDKLGNLLQESEEVIDMLLPFLAEILEGKGGYQVRAGGHGCPKIMSDSLYPQLVADAVSEYVNKEGLVVLISPSQRQQIKLLINDEATCLPRLHQYFEPR